MCKPSIKNYIGLANPRDEPIERKWIDIKCQEESRGTSTEWSFLVVSSGRIESEGNNDRSNHRNKHCHISSVMYTSYESTHLILPTMWASQRWALISPPHFTDGGPADAIVVA